jgi:flagellar hook-associated protein 1 FlgK
LLSQFNTTPLADQQGSSLTDLANSLVTNVTEGSAAATANSTSASTLQAGLVSQNQSVSGVSIDEQAVDMITLQNTYIASAKVISTIQTLLQTLTQL